MHACAASLLSAPAALRPGCCSPVSLPPHLRASDTSSLLSRLACLTFHFLRFTYLTSHFLLPASGLSAVQLVLTRYDRSMYGKGSIPVTRVVHATLPRPRSAGVPPQ